MRKHVLTAIALLPLLSGLSRAEQNWTINPSDPYGIPSEESGTTSYLGVDIVDVSADRLGALKLKEERGVEVTMVDQDAPAGKAGIKEHDVILTLNGNPVESKSQLQRMIHETPAGRVISLGLSRDGQPVTIKVQLGDRKSEFPHVGKSKDDFHFEVPPIPDMHDFDVPNIGVVYVHSSMRSGVMVENLTPQLGDFFGVKSGNGVLIRSVERGSRAEKAGLRAGDVIIRVGDQPIHDTSDFSHALRGRSSGSVTVNVMREKKEQTFTLSLPERKESGEMIEESLEEPEIDADTQIELSDVEDEVAKLRPQLEFAVDAAREASREASQSLCERQQQIREQAKKLREQLGSKIQEDLQKSRERLQEQMEEIEFDLQGYSMDI